MARALVSLLAVALAGCGDDDPVVGQIVLVVESDLSVPDEVDTLYVRLWDGAIGTTLHESTRSLARFPEELAVGAWETWPERVRATVTAQLGATPIATNVVEFVWEPDEVNRVVFELVEPAF